jgi:hypothetical protein
MDVNFFPLGIEPGEFAFKIYVEAGGVDLLSEIATNSTGRVMSTLGRRRQEPPMQIINSDGSFYVEACAHDYGRQVGCKPVNWEPETISGSRKMELL